MLCPYHSVTVTKINVKETCGYFNQVTEWGCVHYGDAYVQDYSEDYYDKSGDATINIPDATGSSFKFLVEYWGTQYDPANELDETDNSELTISVKGISLGTFKHVRNSNDKPHNDDGSVNEDYSSALTMFVSCDELCECGTGQ